MIHADVFLKVSWFKICAHFEKMSNFVKIAGTSRPFSEVLNAADQGFMIIMHLGGAKSNTGGGKTYPRCVFPMTASFLKSKMIRLSWSF